MFSRLFQPKALSLSLRPVGGEFYAHVFENPLTGLARDLFWSFSVEIEPVTVDGEEWECTFDAEWLSWPLLVWYDLEKMTLRSAKLPKKVEASLYLMAEHHPAHLTKFELSSREGASLEVAIEASAYVATDTGKQVVPVSLTARLQFTGIIIVTDNLQSKPSSATAAAEAVSEFIQLDGLREPRCEDWRYVFEPLG
jgi:hypothetical protein